MARSYIDFVLPDGTLSIIAEDFIGAVLPDDTGHACIITLSGHRIVTGEHHDELCEYIFPEAKPKREKRR